MDDVGSVQEILMILEYSNKNYTMRLIFFEYMCIVNTFLVCIFYRNLIKNDTYMLACHQEKCHFSDLCDKI